MEAFRRSRGLEMHRMVARVLPGADAALVRALAEAVAGREDGLTSRHEPVWAALMARWAGLEPAAALAWHHIDPAGAWKWAEGLEDSPVRTRALKELGNLALP